MLYFVGSPLIFATNHSCTKENFALMGSRFKYLYLLFIMALLTGLYCTRKANPAEEIVSRCIEAHGGASYDTIQIGFRFRNLFYTIDRAGGRFEYTRSFTDSLDNSIRDVLNNDQFTRFRNGMVAELEPKQIKAYSSALNSVVYFALLPSGLNDPAVIKEYLGQEDINDLPYYLIKVTFHEDGGGDDFEDEFLYWINQDTNLMDYLAYSFHVDGGGLRFREVISSRTDGGILLLDYNNYKPTDTSARLQDLSRLFQEGKLEKLSEIKLLSE